MNIHHSNTGIFQKTIFILGILAGLSLFGYASINVIVMPAVSPEAFVPKTLVQPDGFPFGLIQIIFVLIYSYAFLPVSIMFTIKRYSENPYAMVLGGSLLCLSLIIEIINSLPFLGMYIYPEQLAPISPDVLLYINQTTTIKFLSFDVAGFTILYVSMLVYAVVYWKSKRILSYLIIISVITFVVNIPFLWFSGNAAVVLMAISIICLVPIPVIFGKMAIETENKS